jgi:hypothetical protein
MQRLVEILLLPLIVTVIGGIVVVHYQRYYHEKHKAKPLSTEEGVLDGKILRLGKRNPLIASLFIMALLVLIGTIMHQSNKKEDNHAPIEQMEAGKEETPKTTSPSLEARNGTKKSPQTTTDSYKPKTQKSNQAKNGLKYNPGGSDNRSIEDKGATISSESKEQIPSAEKQSSPDNGGGSKTIDEYIFR